MRNYHKMNRACFAILATMLAFNDAAWCAPESKESISGAESCLTFPLYNCCALARVKDFQERIERKDSSHKTLILTVHIDEMLMGSVDNHNDVVLVIDGSRENIFAGKSRAEVIGKKIVLAFRLMSGDTFVQREPITSDLPVFDISNVSEFFGDHQCTHKDLDSLRRYRPDKIYPYTECLELQLDGIRDAGAGAIYPPTCAVDATILNVILDDRIELRESGLFSNKVVERPAKFHKGEQFKFRISPEQWHKLFTDKPVRDLVGTKCILSFDCGEKGIEGYYNVYRLEAPFPRQKYSDVEVKDLAARTAESSKYLLQLKRELQVYLEARWSKERIKTFCQTDTRFLPVMQCLVTIGDEGVINGFLYPELNGEVGKISWYCGLRSGMPDEYQVEVQRGKRQFWVLEISRPTIRPLTDDNFVKSIVWEKLFNAWHSYFLLRDRKNKIAANQVLDVGIKSVARIVRNDAGRVTGFVATLEKNHTMTASLSGEFAISNLLVDGEPNAMWEEMMVQAPGNFEKLYRD